MEPLGVVSDSDAALAGITVAPAARRLVTKAGDATAARFPNPLKLSCILVDDGSVEVRSSTVWCHEAGPSITLEREPL
jgi:hypothetical protein